MKKEFFIGALALGVALELSRYAFSSRTKDEIKKRARETHNGKLLSELSHTNGVPMECAHIDHSKSNPDYDTPQNGVYVTIYEHLQDHINREGQNGLSVHANKLAIEALQERIQIWEETRSLDEYYRLTSGKTTLEKYEKRICATA